MLETLVAILVVPVAVFSALAVGQKGRGPPQLSVEQVEELIGRLLEASTPAENDLQYGEGTNLYAESKQIEAKMVQWLKQLAVREIFHGHQLHTDEIDWIKRISCFYLAYAPFLQMCFHEDARIMPTNVFICHSGKDELSYAVPLQDYLEANYVPNVFLAERDLLCGESAERRMLFAAVGCRVIWCAFSESFLKRSEWPLREFLIGRARSVLEKDGFCLLMDCVEIEKETSGVGTWKEILRKSESLSFYDQHGSKTKLAQMQESRPRESFNKRHKRLAELHLCGGISEIIPPRASRLLWSASSCAVGIIHDSFPTQTFKDWTNKAKSGDTVYLCNTWIPNLRPLLVEPLAEAVKRGISLKILLLRPESPLAEARNRALKAKDEAFYDEHVGRGVKENVKDIQIFCQKVKHYKEHVELRFYDSTCSFSIFQVSDSAIVGFYFHERLSICSHMMEVNTQTGIGKEIAGEFDTLWGCGKPVELDRWTSTSPDRRPSMRKLLRRSSTSKSSSS